MFTRELKKKSIQQGPQDWYGALVGFMSPMVGHDLSDAGGALVDAGAKTTFVHGSPQNHQGNDQWWMDMEIKQYRLKTINFVL